MPGGHGQDADQAAAAEGDGTAAIDGDVVLDDLRLGDQNRWAANGTAKCDDVIVNRSGQFVG